MRNGWGDLSLFRGGWAPILGHMAKRILINGNLGYIGPVLARHLRKVGPEAELIGFDTGFFSGCILDPRVCPERMLDAQYFGDVRQFPDSLLEGVDAVIQLAAVSNDPMGKAFEEPTAEINAAAVAAIAEQAKAAGVGHFVFASSCSVYGAGGDDAKAEDSPLNPLTAYARSKIACEEALQPLASEDFRVTCLRFATACGMSPRLRLDLVLNDFVASALAVGKIKILSDGSPWRPLIHVEDMSRAMEWACGREAEAGGPFLVVNTGSNEWNYPIRDLAEAVQSVLSGAEVEINRDAPPDKRSYRVNFDRFSGLAPEHVPEVSLRQAVEGLVEGLRAVDFSDAGFRESNWVRLKVLEDLKKAGAIDRKSVV